MDVFNLVLIILLIIIAFLFLLFKVLSDRENIVPDEKDDKYDIEVITYFVRNSINELLRTNHYDLGLSEEELIKRKNKNKRLRKCLKECTYGDRNAKEYIKTFIKDMLIETYGISEENVNEIMPFHNKRQLSIQEKWDVLIYIYKKKWGYDALTQLIDRNELDKLKPIDEGHEYIITARDIERVYNDELTKRQLNFEDKLMIIVQRIYQNYKGFSVIDEIRDMNIDGVSGGVSGLTPDIVNTMEYTNNEVEYNYDSIWLFYKGKTLHLDFLSFGSERELRRVCENIYKYNNPGQLSESKGYIINDMKDGSRVVVVRPYFSESWAFFVRKFDSIQSKELSELLVDDNNAIIIELIRWLIKGCRIIAITGQQGTGKTTLLMSVIKYINPNYTLRIQESSFELNLRKLFPKRNILTFKETNTISGQQGLDLQKKTDGSVNILGEVATDEVAAWMIQTTQVASIFTLFTHHAKTFRDLIYSLRNALLKEGIFSNEKVAEEQVISVINFNIHLKKDINGHRYIERITECVSKQSKDNLFEGVNIIEYQDGEYQPYHNISLESYKAIRENLTLEERFAFDKFLRKNWGDGFEII